MKRENNLLCLTVCFLVLLPAISWACCGKLVGVADGDTITVLRDKQQVKIRIYGIDCPERGQAFSRKAKQFTSEMVFGNNLKESYIDKPKIVNVKLSGAHLEEVRDFDLTNQVLLDTPKSG